MKKLLRSLIYLVRVPQVQRHHCVSKKLGKLVLKSKKCSDIKQKDLIRMLDFKIFLQNNMEEVDKKVCNREVRSKDNSLDSSYKMEIVWSDVVLYTVFHIIAVVGIYHCFIAKYQTIWFRKCCYYIILCFFFFEFRIKYFMYVVLKMLLLLCIYKQHVYNYNNY